MLKTISGSTGLALAQGLKKVCIHYMLHVPQNSKASRFCLRDLWVLADRFARPKFPTWSTSEMKMHLDKEIGAWDCIGLYQLWRP